MKAAIRLTALALAVMLVLPFGAALAITDGYDSVYTYNYDYWDDYKETPDAYRVSQVIYSSVLGLEKPVLKAEGSAHA